MKRFIAVGDNCIDNYSIENKIYAGGNALNVAVYMKELGIESSFVSLVGDDCNGDFIIREIKKKNIDISHLAVANGKTAETIIKMVNNDRIFEHYNSGVMKQFGLTDEMIDFIEDHELVHTSIDGKILDRLKDLKGVKISCDFSDELDCEIIKKVASELEYAFFSYKSDNSFIRDFMMKIQNMGTKIVIVTLGGDGSLCFDGNIFYKEDSIAVKAIDTLGAGDSYIAGFISGMLNGKSIVESMKLGSNKASKTIQHFGAW